MGEGNAQRAQGTTECRREGGVEGGGGRGWGGGEKGPGPGGEMGRCTSTPGRRGEGFVSRWGRRKVARCGVEIHSVWWFTGSKSSRVLICAGACFVLLSFVVLQIIVGVMIFVQGTARLRATVLSHNDGLAST